MKVLRDEDIIVEQMEHDKKNLNVLQVCFLISIVFGMGVGVGILSHYIYTS